MLWSLCMFLCDIDTLEILDTCDWQQQSRISVTAAVWKPKNIMKVLLTCVEKSQSHAGNAIFSMIQTASRQLDRFPLQLINWRAMSLNAPAAEWNRILYTVDLTFTRTVADCHFRAHIRARICHFCAGMLSIHIKVDYFGYTHQSTHRTGDKIL